MSNFRDAVRAKTLAEVRCPRCQDENTPGRPPKIEVDLERDTASCDTCGHDGPLKSFQKEIRP